MKTQRNLARYRLSLALAGLTTVTILMLGTVQQAHVTTPSWTHTGHLHTARVFHTATLMPNGKVLVVGGISGLIVLNSAEMYDPASGHWSAMGSLNVPRFLFTATLLRNGKVLVAGGNSGPLSPTTNTAELYDPATGIWSATGNLNTTRSWHSAVMLQDGKVLIAGGWDGDSLLQTAEIYDPDTGTWTLTSKLKAARYGQTATLLNDGRALIAGGSDDADLASTLASAELYDPATETWSITGSLNIPRIFQTATLLPNGKVLVAGGYNWPPTSLDSAELYDSANGTWSVTGTLIAARDGQTATLLPNGNVLLAGGVDWNEDGNHAFHPLALSSAESFDPTTETWSTTADLNFARDSHTATLLPNGKVLVAGGRVVNSPLNSAELYSPNESPNPPLPAPRITCASVSGKKLVVVGENFASGALILTNGEKQKTRNDDQNPQTRLIGVKAGRTIKPGDKIQVRNADGTLSDEFIFTGS